MTLRPAPSDPIDLQKRDLRARCLAARRQAAFALGAAAGDGLTRAYLAVLADAGPVVSGYWPMGDEIDCRPLLSALADLGRTIALPVVIGRERPLEFRLWRSGDPLEPGRHGTRHPGEDAPSQAPDVLLVPLLAFDRMGGRLGYGGGYYDRSLEYWRARRPVLAVGVAFAVQEVCTVPRDSHDQRLDWIMTEEGAIRAEPPPAV